MCIRDRIKTALLERIAPHLAPHAVLTTNTSGLPIAQIAAGITAAAGGLRKRFFGTHFFNPPRYMRLLEVIPTAESDPGTVAAFAAFADRILGKQVVYANDTPNFIANRIGIAVMFCAASLMLDQGLTIEEVDALTGTAIGWPRTGTFRPVSYTHLDAVTEFKHSEGAAVGGLHLAHIQQHAVHQTSGLRQKLTPQPLQFVGRGARAQKQPHEGRGPEYDHGQPGGCLPCCLLYTSRCV